MSVETLISLEEYLHTSYSPDVEYLDGVLVERNVGDHPHALLQTALAAYLHNRRKQWNIQACTELRIRIRGKRYRIPDVCVYTLPAPTERVPSRMPFLWIEILSPEDKILDIWSKASELIEAGVPNIWIINPNTLESQLRTSAGVSDVPDKTLRLPDSPIVIPLLDVMAE